MITAEALEQRVIPFASLKHTTQAFIDYAIPECTPKYNYALVGPGVSQDPRQPVSLREPHGFQVGGVSMPHGKVNPPHMHFTCEVFICTRGRWRIEWGFNPEPSSADIGEGDLISVPTWIYRGFRNIGENDGFLFTALGGDNTGGILWAPGTLEAAARQGVHLTQDHRIVDERRGERLAPPLQRLEPMTAEEIGALRVWTPQQMARRIVRFQDLQWSGPALLDSALPGCGAQLASAVGLGMSEDRDAESPVANAHGVSIEWLRIPPGGRVSRHLLAEKQVLIAKGGTIEVEVETSDGPVRHALSGGPAAWDTIALQADCWRTLRNPGSQEGLAILMTTGNHPKRIRWHEDVVREAARAGLAIDAAGCVAAKRFVDRAQP
jgi:quercetin dioxygenase-like cupin family protein